MRLGKAAVLLGLSAAIAALPYLRAQAYTCCDPWGVPAATAFIHAGTIEVAELTAQVEAISTYLKLSFEPTWSNGFATAMEYVSKQTAAERTYEHGRLAASTDLYMNGVRARAAENGIEVAMLDETVTNAVLMSEQFRQERLNRQREDIALADGLRSDAMAPGDAVTRHVAYCGPRAHMAGLCVALPSTTLQDADLMVNTITNPGDGQYETMSDEEVLAGRAFIRNIVAPHPLRSAPGNSVQAQQYEAMLMADQAALSVAGHSLNSVMLHRVRKRNSQ
jgi:hypothetical protein